MRAFSLDLRTRVLADFQSGLTFAELGRKYTVSAEWVRRFIRRHQATGELAARPPINRRVPFHLQHEAALRAAVADDPSLTLESLKARLGVKCDLSTLWYALRKLKISFKKKRSSPPSSNGPTSPRNARNSKSGNSASRIQTASSSSTKLGSKPTGPGSTAGPPRTNG
jgi:transposase